MVSLGLLLGLASLTAAPTALGAPSSGGIPTSGFSVSLSATPGAGPLPLSVTFYATVLSGTPTSYNWSFGDGAHLNGTSAAYVSPTHLYTTLGRFVATVLVHEGNVSGSASLPVDVTASPIGVAIRTQPGGGSAPLTVVFQGSVHGGSGVYRWFNWSFGDGGVGSGLALRYQYSSPGSFRVTLAVTDSDGNSGTASAWVNVTAAVAGTPLPAWGIVGLGAGAGAAVGLAYGGLARARVSVGARSDRVRRDGPAALPQEELGPTVPEATPEVTPPPAPAREGVGKGRPGGGTPAVSREALRLSQRIVVHLSLQGALAPDEVATLGFTQVGMSEALHVSQNALTNVLRRLRAAEVLREDVRHVHGRPRRLKVYTLTPRGEALARDLRHRPND